MNDTGFFVFSLHAGGYVNPQGCWAPGPDESAVDGYDFRTEPCTVLGPDGWRHCMCSLPEFGAFTGLRFTYRSGGKLMFQDLTVDEINLIATSN